MNVYTCLKAYAMKERKRTRNRDPDPSEQITAIGNKEAESIQSQVIITEYLLKAFSLETDNCWLIIILIIIFKKQIKEVKNPGDEEEWMTFSFSLTTIYIFDQDG